MVSESFQLLELAENILVTVVILSRTSFQLADAEITIFLAASYDGFSIATWFQLAELVSTRVATLLKREVSIWFQLALLAHNKVYELSQFQELLYLLH